MTRSGPYGLPGEGDLRGEVALFRHGPHSATAAAGEHRILRAIRAPRLEQIVRMNAELVMALSCHLARMAAHDVVPGPYPRGGEPFVRRPALVNSQEPGGLDASPSS
jgi:hypothetical protein